MTVLQPLCQQYLATLLDQGKAPRTLYTYAKDLEVLCRFFGNEIQIADIRITAVGKFLKSPIFLESKTGKARCARTTDKNLRVIRKFFLWAKGQGIIEALPLPKAIPMGVDEKGSARQDSETLPSVQ
jgi:site-specific recombinase XerD